MTVCEDTLRETEAALEQATNDSEKVRVLLREQIVLWKQDGVPWRKITRTPVWRAFRLIGGS